MIGLETGRAMWFKLIKKQRDNEPTALQIFMLPVEDVDPTAIFASLASINHDIEDISTPSAMMDCEQMRHHGVIYRSKSEYQRCSMYKQTGNRRLPDYQIKYPDGCRTWGFDEKKPSCVLSEEGRSFQMRALSELNGGFSCIYSLHIADNSSPYILKKVALSNVAKTKENIKQCSEVESLETELMILSKVGLLYAVVPEKDKVMSIIMKRAGDEDLGCFVDGIPDDIYLQRDEFENIVFSMIWAVHSFHQEGFIHRDIKLENFMVTRNPNNHGVTDIKLIDFGLSVQAKDPGVAGGHFYMDASLVGTVEYFPLEKHRSAGKDFRYCRETDCYALYNVVLFLSNKYLESTNQVYFKPLLQLICRSSDRNRPLVLNHIEDKWKEVKEKQSDRDNLLSENMTPSPSEPKVQTTDTNEMIGKLERDYSTNEGIIRLLQQTKGQVLDPYIEDILRNLIVYSKELVAQKGDKVDIRKWVMERRQSLEEICYGKTALDVDTRQAILHLLKVLRLLPSVVSVEEQDDRGAFVFKDNSGDRGADGYHFATSPD
jgi:serine/threonine protein kinase